MEDDLLAFILFIIVAPICIVAYLKFITMIMSFFGF